jgi:hypothetical protein
MGLMPPRAAANLREIYACALVYAHDKRLPPDAPRPSPIDAWPVGNFELYERYQTWLLQGGTSEIATRTIYLPLAGHALGLNLKPHPQISLDDDLERALAYVQAKRVSPDWLKSCRNGLELFRRFLRLERGLGLPTAWKPFDLALHTQGLPMWLVNELTRFQHIQQRNWRTERLESAIHRFWCGHLRTWRFLVEQCSVLQLADLKRVHVFDYVDFRLSAGHSVNGVNGDIHTLRSFLIFLQEEGYAVP